MGISAEIVSKVKEMVDGHPAIKMVADDYWKGRKYIQYIIRKNENEILVVTANSRKRNFEEMMQEFGQIMASMSVQK